MITKEIEVNGTTFRLTLTDQVINQVNNLKDLYSQAYEDPESFEQLSSEISNTINEIASSVEPEASDSDLDGLIQEIIKAVENRDEEAKREIEAKPAKSAEKKSPAKKTTPKKKTKGSKK